MPVIMGMNIKNPEAHALAREIAERAGLSLTDAVLVALREKLAAVTASQTRAARLAHRRFGRGRHPARLNLGNCFAYALARETGEPLLCKGNDFAATDLAL